MKIEGKRIKRNRIVQTDDVVVVVEVEMVYPVDDPSEPCYESETVEYLKEVESHAKANDIEWLSQRGKVYRALTPAVA